MMRRQQFRHIADRLPTRDDRGSLAMAMMAVLVGALLGALILPMVISQNKSTRFDMTRVHSLHAAQAGIDVVLGQIRSATTDGKGDPSKLRCDVKGTTDDGGTYDVKVDYWADTPPEVGDAAPAKEMDCFNRFGTFDRATGTATPRYAVIHSTGYDGTVDGGSRGRTVVTTYAFQTDDTHIVGGTIRLETEPNAAQRFCMESDDATPLVGTQPKVKLQPCSVSKPPRPKQVFAYRPDLSIQLVSSRTNNNPNGFCLDTPNAAHTGTPPPNIVLNRCVKDEETSTTCTPSKKCPPYRQQWSINDDTHLEGVTAAAGGNPADPDDGSCINAAGQNSGTQLTLERCRTDWPEENGGPKKDPRQAWVPSGNAGAGMAGPDNNQLVNDFQFAKCLDIPGGGTLNSPYLSVFNCKQNPDPSRVNWNQKFEPCSLPALPCLSPRPGPSAPPADVLLRTKDPTKSVWHCLTSPRADGGFVTVTPCASLTAVSAQRWTIYQTRRDTSGNDLPYAKKFTIVDSSLPGLCLGLGPDALPADLHLGEYYKAVVKVCDGSTKQKWNTSAIRDSANLSDTHECVLPPSPSPSPSPSSDPGCVR